MIRNAGQHSENVRNSLGLNYKSAALPRVLPAQVGPGRFHHRKASPET
jgi:hypothetical protein